MNISGRSTCVLVVVGVLLLGSESNSTEDRISLDNSQTNKDQFTPSLPNPPPPPTTRPKDQTTRGKFNYFDGELLQAVSQDVRGNFVISPASVKTLLGLILEASAYETLGEIKDLLRLPNDTAAARELMSSLQRVLQNMSTSQIEVDSATHSFLSRDFTYNTTYVKAVQDLYKAGVTNVDYKNPESAANKINSWINSRTRGLITSLIEPGAIDPETMTILVNTIYFNGKWKTEFQQKDTTEACFYSEPNLACTKVPMMYKKDLMNYKFDNDHNSHIVQLPYKDERFSMVLVVPANQDGTRKIARDVNRLTFPALLDRATPQQVHLQLPQFTAEYETDLTNTLTKMRLNTVFSSGAKIPFMINNQQARISKIIHKARIEVNEKGTKAAAASGATIVPLMSGDDEISVSANHPFYYFIYEKESRSVLFSGRMSSLSGQQMNEQTLVGGGATPLASSSESGPSNSQARPSNQQGQPSYAQGQQSYAQGQPSYAQGQPSYAQGQPSYAQGQPSYAQGQPSYAQAASKPANPPRNQGYRPGASAPTNPPGTPSFSEPHNEPHNIKGSPKPSQPRPDYDSIGFPKEESPLSGTAFWDDKKRNLNRQRSQQGSSSGRN